MQHGVLERSKCSFPNLLKSGDSTQLRKRCLQRCTCSLVLRDFNCVSLESAQTLKPAEHVPLLLAQPHFARSRAAHTEMRTSYRNKAENCKLQVLIAVPDQLTWYFLEVPTFMQRRKLLCGQQHFERRVDGCREIKNDW